MPMVMAPSSSSSSSSTYTGNSPSPLHAHAAAHRSSLLLRPRCNLQLRLRCSVDAPKQAVQEAAPVAAAGDCFGVFCTTYELRADEETKSWKKLVNVAVSGAAGMISNHLLFKLASSEVFGPDQPVALKLLGSQRSFEALEGVAMELEDSLFPLLREVSIGIDPYEVFQDADWALLIGAKPRGPGMERADLLDINGQIFAHQGKALNAAASRNVKVLVVGNPCNTKRVLIVACTRASFNVHVCAQTRNVTPQVVHPQAAWPVAPPLLLALPSNGPAPLLPWPMVAASSGLVGLIPMKLLC